MFNTMYYLFSLDFLGIPPCCGFMFKNRMQLHHTEMCPERALPFGTGCLSKVQGTNTNEQEKLSHTECLKRKIKEGFRTATSYYDGSLSTVY